MNRKINYLHFLSFIVPFIFIFLIAEQVYADQFTYVKFQKSYKVTKKNILRPCYKNGQQA